MKPVVIYTTPICGFCHAAKRLLDSKGVAYEEIDVLRDSEKKEFTLITGLNYVLGLVP